MKVFSGFLVVVGLLATSAATWAAEFTMDKIEAASKHTEGKDVQNWLSVASQVKSDWLTAKLTGKFYLADLTETYEDSSAVGTDDLFSAVRTNLGFPGWSRDLAVDSGYKWNENFQIYNCGLGYQWRPKDTVKWDVRYSHSGRRASASDREDWNYRLGLAEVSFKYAPERWSYALQVKRRDKLFPNFSSAGGATKSHYNANYTALQYSWDQDLTYNVNSQLKLGLGYSGAYTDYYQDRLRDEVQSDGMVQTKGKKDGRGNKWEITGNYRYNERWRFTGSYRESDYTGFNGECAAAGLTLEGKYTPAARWWLATKLRVSDLCYSNYQAEADEAEDDDADYRSRLQEVIALEYFRKMVAFTYNLEVFARYYDYRSATDRFNGGLIATVTWRWLYLDWYLQAAPNGNLSTYKAKYLFKTGYRF
jgi:hypothetical protein